jgi:predicted small lipoprotein YifL
MARRIIGILVLGLLVAGLAGCGGPAADPPADPLTLVQQAAGYIQEAESFAVTIERSGAPVYIDPGGLINFLRANGTLCRPGPGTGASPRVVHRAGQ